MKKGWVSLDVSLNFGSVQDGERILRFMLCGGVVELNFEPRTIVQFADFLKLLLSILKQFDRIFAFRVAILIQPIVNTIGSGIIVVALEVEDF